MLACMAPIRSCRVGCGGVERASTRETGVRAAADERIEMPNIHAGFYKNGLLRQTQWQHPKLTYLIALAKAYTAADAPDEPVRVG